MPAIINSDDGVVSGSSGLKTSGANDGITVFQQNGTESARITAAGNVGIGTSSPTQELHLYKDQNAATEILIENPNAGTSGRALLELSPELGFAYFTANSSTSTVAAIAGGALGAGLYTTSALTNGLSVGTTAGALKFFAGSTSAERMRIDSSGNVGIGTSSPLATLDVNGTSLFRNTQYTYQPAPTALTGNVTLTAAQILTRIITTTGGSATITMPTGSTLDSGLPSSFPNDGAFDFTIINTDTGQDSLAANTGVTIVGSGSVGTNSSVTFRLRKTGTATYVVYRLT